MAKTSAYYSGLKVGEKVFYDNMEKYGSSGYYKNERTRITCAEYASDMNLKKTKSGITLSKGKREFYHGMYDFLTRPYHPDLYN